VTGWPAPVRVASTGSTNADVADWARAGAPEGRALVARAQVAGRGRLGRAWQTDEGAGVAVSVLLRPVDVAPERWSWLPLLVGLAVLDVTDALGVPAGLKWPNDVLVADEKLAGILVERLALPAGPAAVAGVGVNVAAAPAGTAVPATCLAHHGCTVAPDEVADALLAAVRPRYLAWRAAGGDPDRGLHAAYRERCVSLGRQVQVRAPDGSVLSGTAVDVDGSGRLLVRRAEGPGGDGSRIRPMPGAGARSGEPAVVAVAAGDVVHARLAGGSGPG
jgi:BirA family biotin operon repressor/biotin-[acetyl-CoA-carboxylase] ligase